MNGIVPPPEERAEDSMSGMWRGEEASGESESPPVTSGWQLAARRTELRPVRGGVVFTRLLCNGGGPCSEAPGGCGSSRGNNIRARLLVRPDSQ
ncbi:hypothetical protein MRX96_009123 [Rhipicephalus microplus]